MTAASTRSGPGPLPGGSVITLGVVVKFVFILYFSFLHSSSVMFTFFAFWFYSSGSCNPILLVNLCCCSYLIRWNAWFLSHNQPFLSFHVCGLFFFSFFVTDFQAWIEDNLGGLLLSSSSLKSAPGLTISPSSENVRLFDWNL